MKMQKIIAVMLGCGLSVAAHAGNSFVGEQFALGLRQGNPALIAPLLAPQVRYTLVDLAGGSKLETGVVHARGTLPFMRRADEVTVDSEFSSAQRAKLTLVDEDAMDGRFVEHAELWLEIAGGQITAISEIALEGAYPAPKDCPETSIKRNEVATLNGLLGDGKKTVRLFQTMRNTYGGGAVDPSCKPTPGVTMQDTEVIVQEPSGQVAAYRQLGRVDQTTVQNGIGLYEHSSGGALVSGGAHVYPIDGTGYLFVGRTGYKPNGTADGALTHQVTQYALAGATLRPVWNFVFGGDGGGWNLSAPGADGAIHATWKGAGDCDALMLQWTGKGYKALGKNCANGSWPGEGVLGKNEANLLAMAQSATKEQRKIMAESEATVVRSEGAGIEDFGAPRAGETLVH